MEWLIVFFFFVFVELVFGSWWRFFPSFAFVSSFFLSRFMLMVHSPIMQSRQRRNKNAERVERGRVIPPAIHHESAGMRELMHSLLRTNERKERHRDCVRPILNPVALKSFLLVYGFFCAYFLLLLFHLVE